MLNNPIPNLVLLPGAGQRHGEILRHRLQLRRGQAERIDERHLEDQADRGYVEWRNNSQQPLFWPPQQRSFDIGGLIRLIITLATGAPPGSPVKGQQWIRDDQDRTLSEIAGKLP